MLSAEGEIKHVRSAALRRVRASFQPELFNNVRRRRDPVVAPLVARVKDEQHARVARLIAFGLMQMLVTVLIVNVLRFHGARGSASSARRVTAVASTPAADLRSATSPAGSMIDAGVMTTSS